MNERKSAAVHTAIARLASLYEFGELQAQTSQAEFLQRVADDVEQLRELVRRARDENAKLRGRVKDLSEDRLAFSRELARIGASR
jgi:hypothetical protein